jgi:hypothetical protein
MTPGFVFHPPVPENKPVSALPSVPVLFADSPLFDVPPPHALHSAHTIHRTKNRQIIFFMLIAAPPFFK